LILPVEPLWETFRPRLEMITSYAVVFRYPGESATREMAKQAVADANAIRRQIRRAFNLPENP
jgi:hypothetical protein